MKKTIKNINDGTELKHVIGPLYIKKTLKHFNFPDGDTIKKILIGIVILVIGIGVIIEMLSFNNKDIDTLVHNKYSNCVINEASYERVEWFGSTLRPTDDINKAARATVSIATNNEERVLYFEKESSLLNDLIFHKIAFKEIGDYPKYCTSEKYFEYLDWDSVYKINSTGTFKYNYIDNIGWEKIDGWTYSEICFQKDDHYVGQPFVFISKEEADKKIQKLIEENAKDTFDKGVK